MSADSHAHGARLPVLPKRISDDIVQSPTPRFNCFPDLGVSMRCSHCEKCCQDTEMELCMSDVARLERRGYQRDVFSQLGADGVHRLRNSGGYCFFYDRERKRCKEYASRPRGCTIYPVISSAEDGIIVDKLCPEADTLTQDEILSKGRRLQQLLGKIDSEARKSFYLVKSAPLNNASCQSKASVFPSNSFQRL